MSASTDDLRTLEIDKLFAETTRLNAETSKINAETRMINEQLRAHPWLPLFTAIIGGGIIPAAIGALLALYLHH
ncbi:hypothetical protein [Acidocella aminolytica]|uniref:Uncharacterized protein n=1 Tax=Acidocella aminolytica 101 = DSM 11237 TaxID=1120923 RepID=A0A0D6PEL4_9PROT|nr:hypothetical protein [Acidocella aminolytica]GAN79796.1 hypothetical protein Aam_030_029 [Acidocella aminolytica 101 = DSM 11237]GBQ32080.1 hypothetical protein AA11237_0064 [Acidocella aminolytica 101 = DSM 11237]SHF35453.1 hypothetical protein SAMN02746095_02937 [Acidocella aminolytica 101 = DSM 11237]